MLDATVPATAHGYRLRVREPAAQERVVTPEMTPIVIGREEDCDLEVDDLQVSRHHAQLEIQPDGRVVIRDLGSANGTFVEATRLWGAAWLALPGTITVGRTTIVVEHVS